MFIPLDKLQAWVGHCNSVIEKKYALRKTWMCSSYVSKATNNCYMLLLDLKLVKNAGIVNMSQYFS